MTLEPGRGSSEAITKIATGTSDIGSVGIDALMAARATENVPVTAVMNIFNTGPHAFYTTTGSGIATLAGEKGEAATDLPFTSSNVVLPLVLEENGKREADIALTKSDPGALGPLLMADQSDVIIASLTDMSRYQGQAAEAGKELVILCRADAGLELYSAALAASNTFLTERPDVAKRFVAAFRQSLEFANANPDAVDGADRARRGDHGCGAQGFRDAPAVGTVRRRGSARRSTRWPATPGATSCSSSGSRAPRP